VLISNKCDEPSLKFLTIKHRQCVTAEVITSIPYKTVVLINNIGCHVEPDEGMPL